MKRKRKIRQLKSSDVKPLRERLLKKQKGLCAICEKPVLERACLDHQHKKRIKGTGLVRGVLCSNCNVFLGKAENNCIRYGISIKTLPETLRKMALYLERKHYPYMHPSEKPKTPSLKKTSFNKASKLYTAKYPMRKSLEYPKSKKLTKGLEKIFKEFGIEPEFLKGK